MAPIPALLFATALGFAPSAAPDAAERLAALPAAAQATAFVGVHVVTMEDDQVLRDQTVIVSGERIASIGPARPALPPGAARRSGAGREAGSADPRRAN